ncbi:hypothetical protein IKG50_00315 [Candidatus Saccharibacteria bacterium]|nr:hypothetical protein [Candidatus Saccharibacteria bacterium]
MKNTKRINHKKRLLLGVLALGIFVVIGGVIAVSHDSSIFDGLFHLKSGETTFTDIVPPDDWKRCDEAPKEVVTSNSSTFDIKVRMKYDEYWLAQDGINYLPVEQNGQRLTTINLQNQNDWEDGHDGWIYWKGTVAPGSSTRSLLKSVTYNCDSGTIVETICHDTPTGQVCEQPEDPYEGGDYHVFVTVQTTEENGQFPDDTYFDVSINPNGGEYNGSTSTYVGRVPRGTTIDLSNTSYINHELIDWTLNSDTSYTGSVIVANEDISLVANWDSGITWNVTVDPNGGTYDGSTSQSTYQVSDGQSFTADEPTREDYAFEGWELADGTPITSPFTVTSDVTIRATWAPAVARIERTGTLYSSITKADIAAQTDDTITLLVNTTEDATITKTVTLDLNEKTVTGSITNNGSLTLVNGEVNNANGAAVTNNATFTMGINDYNPDGTAHIDNNYVRLIGSTVGIDQNGTYNFYDGFLEGDIGLDGPYHDAPSYRKVDDGSIVHYFPFVDHIGNTERQHVELANADLAVSKTSVGGDIYYYNLQDNINTSAATGYQIYVVRDFPASYPITSKDGTDVDIDLVGYTISSGENITINGNLTISDSGKEEDPTIKGKITVRQGISVTQNGVLNIDGTEIQEITSNTLITNVGDVNLTNGSKLSSIDGTVMEIDDNTAMIDMDSTSIITSSSSSNPTILNTKTAPLEIPSGIIESAGNYAIRNNSSSQTVTINGGEVRATGTASAAIYGGTTNITSGTITVNTSSTAAAINGSGSMSGGTINVTTSDGDGYGVRRGECDTFTVSGGTITVNANDEAYGLRCRTTTVTGGTINANSETDYGIGIYGTYTTITGGAINAFSDASLVEAVWVDNVTFGGTASIYAKNQNSSRNVYGIEAVGTLEISGGKIVAETESGNAYGVYNTQTTQVTDINVSASSTNGDGYGIRINGGNNYITGGTVRGSSYGISAESNTDSIRIGTDDTSLSTISPDIAGDKYGLYGEPVFSFFDGVLRGNTASYNTGVIAAITDGASFHTESSADYSCNTWLEAGQNYLSVNGVEYNSLTSAYAAAADGDTVMVTKDISVVAALPTNPSGKTIHFDLNGHDLIYSDSLPNDGTMEILDSGTGGSLTVNNSVPTVINNGTLTVSSGEIVSTSNRTIQNSNNATLTVSGGEIKAINSATDAVYLGTTTMTGGTITVNTNSTATAINGSGAMSGGTINVTTTNGDGYGVRRGECNTFDFSGGTITVNANDESYGIYCRTTTMTSGTINSHSESDYSYGIYGTYSTISAGIINSTSDDDNSYGVATDKITFSGTAEVHAKSLSGSHPVYGLMGDEDTVSVSGGTITAEAKNGIGYGVQNNNKVEITNGSISGTSDGGTGYGVYITYRETDCFITGGTVYGSNIGIFTNSSSNSKIRIGTNDTTLSIASPDIAGEDYALSGNAFYFYDGVLRGNTDAYEAGVIKAIPDGTTYHDESSASYSHNVWLEAGQDYLSVNGTTYNSLTGAYNAISGEGTIQVIRDATIVADLPTNPSDKIVHFDLNGHNLAYSSTMKNDGTLEILDSSQGQSGTLTTTNNNPVILNNNSLTISSGKVTNNKNFIIQNDNDNGTTTIATDGVVEGTGTAEIAIAGGTTKMSGGTITMNTSDTATAIGGSGSMTGGTINITTSDGRGFGVRYELYSSTLDCSSFSFEGGTINVNANDDSFGIKCRNTYLRGGTVISASQTGDTYGIGGAHSYLTSGSVTATGKNGYTYGVFTDSVSMSGATTQVHAVNNTSNHRVYGLTGDEGNISISGGTVVAESNIGTAYGVENRESITMTGGDITAASTTGAGYGVYSDRGVNTITDGTIYGSSYGVYAGTYLSAEAKFTIGANDDSVSTVSPDISGDLYALGGHNFYFYDGVLRGDTNAYEDGVIKNIPDNYTMYITSGSAHGKTFSDVRYLIAEYDVAEINGVRYKSLPAAIDAANAGDTITLIDDALLFSPLEISSSKDFTLETDGNDIIAGNPITNNGDVKIINSNSSVNPSISYAPAGYFIRNNSGASLEIENIPLASDQVIKNDGALTLKNVAITATDTAIRTTGDLTISNGSTITSDDYGVYSGGNANTINIASTSITAPHAYYQAGAYDSTIANSTIDGRVTNNSGKLTFNGGTVERSGVNVRDFVSNTGSADTTFNGTTLTFTHTDLTCYACSRTTIMFNNTGKLSFTNNATATETFSTGNTDTNYLIKQTSGELNITDSSLTSSFDSSITTHNDHQGLIIDAGTANIANGTISVNGGQVYGINNDDATISITGQSAINAVGDWNTAYGIYINTGEVTMGVPEDPNSQDYGKATADVSTTDPSIRGISTNTGIGIKVMSGLFNFYDGRITGSTSAMPETPANVEYNYEPKYYTDLDGYEYCILEWMRS